MFLHPTIGADPEVFVRDTKTKKFVTAEGLITGTKRNPIAISYNSNGMMQVDGVAAEFNTEVCYLLDSVKTRTSFVNNVVTIQKDIEGIIKKRNKSLELVAVPTADFDEDYFNSLSEESRELGCDPDYNGYDGMANRRPDNTATYRTGSGHVHVGWRVPDELQRKGVNDWDIGDNDHYEKCMAMAVELDFYLGLPSLLWDADARRRTLYGRAGAFRPKVYGMEYRVLSNAWVADPKLIAFVYDQTRLCVEQFDKVRLFDKFGTAAADFINASDVDAARTLMKDANINFPEI